MQKLLNKDELEIIQGLINVGLAVAAKAFSSMTGENVSIVSSKIEIDDAEGLKFPKGDNVHVLVTNVLGEVEGICFLIFSESEVKNLVDISLPTAIINQPHKKKMMTDGFLLETDNIITASVVNQFANFLDKYMYGAVPALHRMPEKEVETYVDSFMEDGDHLLLFKTNFSAEKADLEPEFVWLMKEKFLQRIKKIAESGRALNKLSKLS